MKYKVIIMYKKKRKYVVEKVKVGPESWRIGSYNKTGTVNNAFTYFL